VGALSCGDQITAAICKLGIYFLAQLNWSARVLLHSAAHLPYRLGDYHSYLGPREGRGYVHCWGITAMKHTNMAIAMIALVASAVGQAPNKISPDKPNLREPFAKASLQALIAIRDFKGTAGLTGRAKDAYEDARTHANSANAPETLMIANLTNFAIMRSADNLARENIMQKATAKVDHDGVPPNAYLTLKRMRQDPELSVALDSINERESGCSAELEKAFRRRIAIPLPGTCSDK
jgi:hypothetical protein